MSVSDKDFSLGIFGGDCTILIVGNIIPNRQRSGGISGQIRVYSLAAILVIVYSKIGLKIRSTLFQSVCSDSITDPRAQNGTEIVIRADINFFKFNDFCISIYPIYVICFDNCISSFF